MTTLTEITSRDAPPHPVRRFLTDFPWIHTGIGILGNTLFFVGSVLFLWESTKRIGVWLFIIGTLAMLVGSVGNAIVKLVPSSEEEGS